MSDKRRAGKGNVILSSTRVRVPTVFMAPTVITNGLLPGAVIVAYPCVPAELFRPSLPAETTTTIPACQACCTAWHSQWVCLIRGVDWSFQGKTNHANVVGLPELDRLLDRSDYRTVGTAPRLVERAETR